MDNNIAAPDRVARIARGSALFRRTSLSVFVVGFATVALLYCVQPLLAVFSAEFGVGAAAASLSLSLSTGLLALAMPLAGTLSEVTGRKPLMSASLLLSAVLVLLSAMPLPWSALLFVRALLGVALSGLPAVAMAYIAEEMEPRALSLAMGVYVGGTGLGGMAGRLLSGAISDVWGWRAAVAVIGLLGLVSWAIVWRGLPPSRHFIRREPHLPSLIRAFGLQLRDPALRLLFAEGFLLMGSFVTIYNYIGYRLLGPPISLSQTEIGFIFTVYLFGVVGSTCGGFLAGRFGRERMLPASVLMMLAGLALTLPSQLWLIIAGIALLTGGFFAAHAVVSAWVSARARAGKAQAASLYLFAYYFGSSVVGSLGGLFWSRGAWPAVIALTATLVLTGLAIALWLGRSEPPHTA